MNFISGPGHYRLAGALFMAAVLAGCGPSDDKAKSDQKPAPPAPPKVTPAPAPVTPAPPKVSPAPVKAAPTADARRLREGWVLLGQQQVGHKTERERIEVGGGSRGPYRELLVTVQGAPLTIDQMTVTFGNRTQFKSGRMQQFDAKTSSRTFDLPGETRAIRHVDFVYQTTARFEGQATVMLYGR